MRGAAAVLVDAAVRDAADLRARWRAGEISYDVYGMRAEDES